MKKILLSLSLGFAALISFTGTSEAQAQAAYAGYYNRPQHQYQEYNYYSAEDAFWSSYLKVAGDIETVLSNPASHTLNPGAVQLMFQVYMSYLNTEWGQWMRAYREAIVSGIPAAYLPANRYGPVNTTDVNTFNRRLTILDDIARLSLGAYCVYVSSNTTVTQLPLATISNSSQFASIKRRPEVANLLTFYGSRAASPSLYPAGATRCPVACTQQGKTRVCK